MTSSDRPAGQTQGDELNCISERSMAATRLQAGSAAALTGYRPVLYGASVMQLSSSPVLAPVSLDLLLISP